MAFDTEQHQELPGHSSAAASVRSAAGLARVQVPGLMSVLSLFLLLLAFFILLNSLAQPEAQRTRAVLGSLAATFNVSDPDGRSRTLGSFVGHLEAVDDLEREITGLLRTVVGFGSFELIRTGTLLSTTLDNNVLFDADGNASETLQKLAEPAGQLLASASDVVTIEMAAYARPAGGTVAGARSRAIDRASARAGEIARTFAGFGAPASQLVVALEDGRPGQTRIEFRVLAKAPGEEPPS